MPVFMPPCGSCENKGCGEYHSKCEKYRKYREDVFNYKRAVNRERAENWNIVGSLMQRHGNIKTRKAAYNEKYYGQHKRR